MSESSSDNEINEEIEALNRIKPQTNPHKRKADRIYDNV